MTLTPRVVNAAAGRVVLLTGAGKAEALAAWLTPIGARPAVPIARLRGTGTVVFADRAAAKLVGGDA
jgi:6-phosphogluconolactonase/glucosamine-6-phosphate isomerase/deaminase